MVEAKARRSTLASRPFCTAVARIIISRARKLWSYQAATLTGDNMEALHQMRVASRRLRAAFDACQPCLPPREYRRLRQTIGAVTDQLGAVRDCDVMLDFLRRERAQALTEEQAGLDDLIQRLAGVSRLSAAARGRRLSQVLATGHAR
jgi:CHAD domain-containing protein